MSFKSLIKTFALIASQGDYDAAIANLELSLANEKISWEDYEVLTELLGKISY